MATILPMSEHKKPTRRGKRRRIGPAAEVIPFPSPSERLAQDAALAAMSARRGIERDRLILIEK